MTQQPPSNPEPELPSAPLQNQDLDSLFTTGLSTRRTVVGPNFVTKALTTQNTTFSYPMQQLVTSYCWGWLWNRPGLSKRDRSLLNIAMLMALNRSTELGVHVRGARRNGVSELEIREVILHATVYCGVPAGVEAIKVAEGVLDQMAGNGEVERELGGRFDVTELLGGVEMWEGDGR